MHSRVYPPFSYLSSDGGFLIESVDATDFKTEGTRLLFILLSFTFLGGGAFLGRDILGSVIKNLTESLMTTMLVYTGGNDFTEGEILLVLGDAIG